MDEQYYKISGSTLQGIADALRNLFKTTTKYKVKDFASVISDSISSGGIQIATSASGEIVIPVEGRCSTNLNTGFFMGISISAVGSLEEV